MKIVKASPKQLKNPIVKQTAGSLTKFVSPSKLGVSFSKILRETKKKTTASIKKLLKQRKV